MVFEGETRVLAPCGFCGRKRDVDLLYRVSYTDAAGFEVAAGTACERCLERLDRYRRVGGKSYFRVLRAF